MDKTQLEIRNISGNIIRSDDTRYVEGYALVFNSKSEDLGFYEVIDRNAISQAMIDSCDVFALLNHDDNRVLARSKNGQGSLKLEVDDKGLHYSFDAPKTALGDELLEYLSRGEITGSSFAFYIDWEDDTAQSWKTINGVKYRYIHKISYIHDVSPVFVPAYNATSVSKRALDKCKELDEEIRAKEEAEKQAEEERIKQENLSKFEEVENQLNDLYKDFLNLAY